MEIFSFTINKEYLEIFKNIISIVGAAISFLIWLKLKMKERSDKQSIKIKLKMPEFMIDLPCEIERKFLTRAELMGMIGILKAGRYDLRFLSTPEFFANLKAAQKDKNSIEIICYEDEVGQFDLAKIKLQCVTYPLSVLG